jgi:uncharacterized membrane protein YhhN
MIPGLMLVLAVAVVDWVAVAKGWRKVELIAKPWTMAALVLILVLRMWEVRGPGLVPLAWFGAGLLLSLAGDVFLMINLTRFSSRWFLAGLGAFLLAHVAYIIGLNMPLPLISPLWSLGLALLLAITASRILRRIIAGVREKGLKRMAAPVGVYGIVITLMLLSALLTLYRTDWLTPAAGLVSVGAALFYLSDVVLAWDKFVAPVKKGRLVNMIAYHLGQIAIAAGVMIQFGG